MMSKIDSQKLRQKDFKKKTKKNVEIHSPRGDSVPFGTMTVPKTTYGVWFYMNLSTFWYSQRIVEGASQKMYGCRSGEDMDMG